MLSNGSVIPKMLVPRAHQVRDGRSVIGSGSGRRGPADLWDPFDEAVAELERISEGRSIMAVGRAYAELGEIGSQLAHAIEREDRANGLLPRVAGKRRGSG